MSVAVAASGISVTLFGTVMSPDATEPANVWRRLLFVGLCVLIPVVWGVRVNWLFNLWSRRPPEADGDRIFPDYQI